MRRKDAVKMFWKRTFLVDPPDAGASGAGGTGVAVKEPPVKVEGEESKPEIKGPTPEEYEALKKNYDELKTNNEKLGKEMGTFREWYQQVAPQVEFTQNGKLRLKEDPNDLDPVDEKIINVVQRTNAELQRQQNTALSLESAALKSVNGDPLYSKVVDRAKEVMRDVPIHRHTEKAWKSAIALAKGELVQEYVALGTQKREGELKAEFSKQQDAAIVVGGERTGAEEGEVTDDDVKNFRWTPSLREAARKQIDHGMVKDSNQWARAYLRQKNMKGGGE